MQQFLHRLRSLGESRPFDSATLVGTSEQELNAIEVAIGSSLPADYRNFAKTFGSSGVLDATISSVEQLPCCRAA